MNERVQVELNVSLELPGEGVDLSGKWQKGDSESGAT